MNLLWTALLGVALAATTAEDIARMDADLAPLQAGQLSADPVAAKAEVLALATALRALGKDATRATSQGGSAHKSRVFTRLGQGQLAFAAALVSAPCPQGLSPELCELYAGELTRRASALVGMAEPVLERARQEAITGDSGTDRLRSADRKRLKAAMAQLDALKTKTFVKDAIVLPKTGLLAATSEKKPNVPYGAPGEALTDFPAAPAHNRAAAEPDRQTDFVLVDKTAWLTSHADGTGQRFRGADAPDPDGDLQLWTARLLSVEGDWALLEFGAGSWTYHCSLSKPWSPEWRVRVWTDRAALQSVVTSAVRESHADGTLVDILPGTPVVKGGVQMGRLRVPVELPADHVGDRYREAEQLEKRGGSTVAVPTDTALAVGGQAVPLPSGDEPLYAVDSGEGQLTFESRCGRVVAAGTVAEGGGMSGLMGVLGGIAGLQVARYQLRAGTPLWWPDGTRAGTLAADRTVPMSDFPEKEPGLRCVSLQVDHYGSGNAAPPGRAAEVCVRAAE
jgi:hypothetical protein